MRVGIAFDLAPPEKPADGPDDRFEEFDKPETVEALAAVLRAEGHSVALLGDGREFLRKVLDDPPDFVWNLAEGEGVGRSREARVPAALEMLGIPYSGSDPLTLAASLDKSVAKVLVSNHLRVPHGTALSPAQASVFSRDGHAQAVSATWGSPPWIVKPAFEGSSKGIRGNCLADSPGKVAELVVRLARDYQQPILIEEFIAGDEVTVGLIGNGDDLRVLGTMRVHPKSGDPRFVYSIESKRDWDERIRYDVPAPLPAGVLEKVEHAALVAFHTLECRDLARIDFRVRDGEPYFIEANPLPGLAPDWSDLMILARGMGVSHAEVIRRVLHAALTRVGLSPGPRA